MPLFPPVPISTVGFFPGGTKFFLMCLVDEANTAGAKNFLSHFNPGGSGKNIIPVQVEAQSYTTGNVAVAASLTVKRITAASGGSVQAASSIGRNNPLDADPITEIRTGNPTVTAHATQTVPFFSIAPVVATGGGAVNAAFISPPAGLSISGPGNGFVFGTSSGAAGQLWNIRYIWGEF